MAVIKFKLRDLNMDEVSLVDAGDNPHARVVMVKRVGGVTEEDPLVGEQPIEATFDDGDLFIKTASGRIYESDEFSYDEENDEWEVDSAHLLVDLIEDEHTGDDDDDALATVIEADDGVLKRAMRKFAEALYAMVEDDSTTATVEKGHFKDELESRARAEMAEQAYREMTDYCNVLRGAIDMGVYSGEAASDLKETVAEFSEIMNKAIDKWSSGSTLNKQIESDLLDRAYTRDEEVFGASHIDEGDEDVTIEGEEVSVEKSLDTTQREGRSAVAGIDRSKLSKSERDYIDEVETENERLKAEQQQRGQSTDDEEEEQQDQPAAEGAQTSDPSASAGVNPEDVQGDDGTHQSPFEKALGQVSDPAARELIKQLMEKDDEETYVSKAQAFSALPVSPQEVGAVLHRIAKGRSTRSDEEFIVETLKSANELARAGGAMFASVGATPPAVPGSAQAEVMAKARQVASAEGITEELALAKVRRDPANRELVERYTEEVSG